MSRAPRAGARASWPLVWLVLLFTTSTFARAAHWLSVPHRLCPVHGTLEHGREAGESPAPRSASDPDGPAFRGSGRAHDECPLSPQARTEVTLLPGTLEARGLVQASAAASFVRSDPTSSIALLSLAPKHSPPA